ncbi:hypothetical protein FH972_020968 [Carpinus fangiana]|uniref:Uncharacterized protein n=1 Tax=Carpinus fangiana TaxID=176857 RepID=A0A5N6KQ26_9ROSI|nr:hypothetical protein FH972_020968 [Carpinus fangiana]
MQREACDDRDSVKKTIAHVKMIIWNKTTTRRFRVFFCGQRQMTQIIGISKSPRAELRTTMHLTSVDVDAHHHRECLRFTFSLQVRQDHLDLGHLSRVIQNPNAIMHKSTTLHAYLLLFIGSCTASQHERHHHHARRQAITITTEVFSAGIPAETVAIPRSLESAYNELVKEDKPLDVTQDDSALFSSEDDSASYLAFESAYAAAIDRRARDVPTSSIQADAEDAETDVDSESDVDSNTDVDE